MDKKYYTQSVEITIERDSDLFRRISDRAARDGMTVEGVVDMLVKVGALPDMARKLDAMDRLEARRK